MAASDAAGGIPTKNEAWRETFEIRDINGDLVSGASGLDTEVSIDGAAFGDATNEATEIGSTGVYYIDLTAAEMNGDTIVVKITSTTIDSKDIVMIFHPSAEDFDAAKTSRDANNTIVAAILVDTAEIGTAGAGLTDLGGMSTDMKAEVNAECDTAITDGDIATETKQDIIDTNVDSLITTIGTAGDGLTDVSLGATGLTNLFARAMVELSAGAPSATPTFNDCMMAFYHAAVHEFEHNRTTGLRKVKDSGGTTLFKASITDDGTTTTIGKAVAP